MARPRRGLSHSLMKQSRVLALQTGTCQYYYQCSVKFSQTSLINANTLSKMNVCAQSSKCTKFSKIIVNALKSESCFKITGVFPATLPVFSLKFHHIPFTTTRCQLSADDRQSWKRKMTDIPESTSTRRM